jgi:hypothetical protein
VRKTNLIFLEFIFAVESFGPFVEGIFLKENFDQFEDF